MSKGRGDATPRGGFPARIGELLPPALERIAGHGLFTEAKVRKVWPAVVGANVAANASVRRLRGKALEVDVPSDAWATELSYLSAAIVQKLNARLGADTVDKLIVRRRRKR